MRISVLIAEDNSVFRDGISTILSRYHDIELWGAAEDGAQLLQMAQAQKPDVVLTDIVMPGLNGIETCRQLQQLYPGLPVLAVSLYNDNGLVEQMRAAGASGYLRKNCREVELLAAIRQVYGGGEYYCSETKPVIEFLKRRAAVLAAFSESEIRIMQLLCRDKDTKEMAQLLGLKESTVGFYRKELLRKCSATTSAGVVMFAVKWKVEEMEMGV